MSIEGLMEDFVTEVRHLDGSSPEEFLEAKGAGLGDETVATFSSLDDEKAFREELALVKKESERRRIARDYKARAFKHANRSTFVLREPRTAA